MAQVMRPILLLGVPALTVAGALYFWVNGGRHVATENAYVKADIVQIAAETAGKVYEIAVRDHAQVRVGDVLMRLDPEPLQIALAKAEAEVDGSRGQVRTLIASYREALSELAEAKSRVGYWNAQLERNKQLAQRGILASAKFEEVESNAVSARDKVVVAERKVDRTLAQLGNQPERLIDLHPLVRERIATRDRAKFDLDRATLKAPISGTIVNLRLQPGDQVRAATPLFSIVADTQAWVEANYKETELTHVRPGLAASVVLDIYPDIVWRAEVESISPATGAEFALLPPQNASGNWVKIVQRLPVKLRLVPIEGGPPLRAGMTATVRIDTRRERRIGQLLKGWTAMARSRE
jgi:membrane fusion protein (multidrug efflux system)